MSKKQQINQTVGRVGAMLRQGRRLCKMEQCDAAKLMRISTAELDEYERGFAEIPLGPLEHIFTMGYKMMQVRSLEHRYHTQRSILRKIKALGTSVPE
ncbi:hypothetical protein HDR66_01330 [bacterium]|nr:hypothetical protein [bacterium]